MAPLSFLQHRKRVGRFLQVIDVAEKLALTSGWHIGC